MYLFTDHEGRYLKQGLMPCTTLPPCTRGLIGLRFALLSIYIRGLQIPKQVFSLQDLFNVANANGKIVAFIEAVVVWADPTEDLESKASDGCTRNTASNRANKHFHSLDG